VDELDQPIRHLPFFETLASLDETSAEWRASSAGLVVLRLVDAWFDEGIVVAQPDAWGLDAVRETVDAMSPGDPARAILAGLVETMSDAPSVDFTIVAPRLMAYGRPLRFDAKWRLAGDVYATVLAHAHPIDEADVYIDASMQLGLCSRMLGAWDVAAAAYAEAGRVATSIGDVVGILRARIADARLSMSRGNLPRAEEILDDTIARATAESLDEVTGTALHERATLAIERGEYEQSIRFAYRALAKMSGQAARDRVLADIAGAFLDLGVRSVARDAFLVLAATAQEQYVRWTSTLNLFDIAIRDGSEPAFEMYRRQLADADLPVALAVYFHLISGKGFETFGRVEQARRALTQAIDLAAAYRLNQLLFTAEESLKQLEAGEAATAAAAATGVVPHSVADVAAAIKEMKALAVVGSN
jgi:tetratricopeptide (TPR) repeat protein